MHEDHLRPGEARCHAPGTGLDFADADEVFAGLTLDQEDDRFDYGERRITPVGHLRGRTVIIVWTPRGDARHVILLRKANDREKARFGQRLGQG
ncbi:BrnT family toxin [Microvirga aerophila]|uniref:BrnT family toxin n=1 Tax=Microvirga aerophila TaxID=670291 RepID=UPI002803E79B|nr:BrnT family toxin [Microvirga aerophila]